MISREQLDEFIEHYGQIAVHTFTVPVDRDKLKEVVLTFEDLKRMKKRVEDKEFLFRVMSHAEIERCIDLLARLECAEAVCLIVGQSFMPIDKAEAIELLLIAWRKSCGRED